MIKYNFNKDIQVLEVTYEGDINTEDIINHVKYILENYKLPSRLNILTDSRNASYKFDPKRIKELLTLLDKNLKYHDLINDAFIHSKPIETAYSQLVEFENKHSNYSHKTFSTKQAALNWLNNQNS